MCILKSPLCKVVVIYPPASPSYATLDKMGISSYLKCDISLLLYLFKSLWGWMLLNNVCFFLRAQHLWVLCSRVDFINPQLQRRRKWRLREVKWIIQGSPASWKQNQALEISYLAPSLTYLCSLYCWTEGWTPGTLMRTCLGKYQRVDEGN